eukprot:SAG31_NODE_4626_length_3087_cov_4.080991_5_plen_127_part_00
MVVQDIGDYRNDRAGHLREVDEGVANVLRHAGHVLADVHDANHPASLNLNAVQPGRQLLPSEQLETSRRAIQWATGCNARADGAPPAADLQDWWRPSWGDDGRRVGCEQQVLHAHDCAHAQQVRYY